MTQSITKSITKSLIVTGLLLLAPAALAQNTITPGQSEQDRGARGPQPTDALAASGVINGGAPNCGPQVGSTATPPCGVTGAAPTSDVGSSGPVAPRNQPDATSSSSMLHQEMKQIETAQPPPAPQR